MRVAITGCNGQLGMSLVSLLSRHADVTPLSHSEIEITDLESVDSRLDECRPDIVINTAAYNAVDRAEEELQAAFGVNAAGPMLLSRYCQSRGVTLVHVSTDYVFSGYDRSATSSPKTRATPYEEEDCPDPPCVYALSKYAGEQLVRKNCERHFVVRTCGLYGHAAVIRDDRGNFVETMLRLGQQRDEIGVVNDQLCTPSFVDDVAEAVAELIKTQKYGTYHVTNSGETTWHGFATEIFRLTNMNVTVNPITTVEFGAAATRPVYSVLDGHRLAEATGKELPHWSDALARYLALRSELKN